MCPQIRKTQKDLTGTIRDKYGPSCQLAGQGQKFLTFFMGRATRGHREKLFPQVSPYVPICTFRSSKTYSNMQQIFFKKFENFLGTSLIVY